MRRCYLLSTSFWLILAPPQKKILISSLLLFFPQQCKKKKTLYLHCFWQDKPGHNSDPFLKWRDSRLLLKCVQLKKQLHNLHPLECTSGHRNPAVARSVVKLLWRDYESKKRRPRKVKVVEISFLWIRDGNIKAAAGASEMFWRSSLRGQTELVWTRTEEGQ